MDMSTPVVVVVELKNANMWEEQRGSMEMISRRPTPIFPILDCLVAGLHAESLYEVQLTIERLGSSRMAFADGKWTESKKRSAKQLHHYKSISLPGGPRSGRDLMKDGICFGTVKISSRSQDRDLDNVIYLDTMHVYTPTINIANSDTGIIVTRAEMNVASFIPVTIYQNPTIGVWKSKHNKFATVKNGGQGKKKQGDGGNKDSGLQKQRKNPINNLENDENRSTLPFGTFHPEPIMNCHSTGYNESPYFSYGTHQIQTEFSGHQDPYAFTSYTHQSHAANIFYPTQLPTLHGYFVDPMTSAYYNNATTHPHLPYIPPTPMTPTMDPMYWNPYQPAQPMHFF